MKKILMALVILGFAVVLSFAETPATSDTSVPPVSTQDTNNTTVKAHDKAKDTKGKKVKTNKKNKTVKKSTTHKKDKKKEKDSSSTAVTN